MQGEIFNEIVAFSTQLRQANVTLYNINPLAVRGSLAGDYYQGFLKGVSKPGQVLIGNVGLQVLAVQSGGLVLQSSTDVAAMIQKCLLDTQAWYEISFEPQPTERPDAYHHIDVELDKPGLTARTRDGYYSNPTVDPLR
jgi:hypothetical protein